MTQFQKDLEFGHIAEQKVLEVFSSRTSAYAFVDVSSNKEYFNRGDIVATEKATGRQILIEVKNDSRISETNNILCEEDVYFKERGEWVEGNMHSNYEIYCVVSQEAKKIYVIDFKVLKEYYRAFQPREIDHPSQMSIVRFVPVKALERLGGLIAVVDY